jgi:hypothetical protein
MVKEGEWRRKDAVKARAAKHEHIGMIERGGVPNSWLPAASMLLFASLLC